MKISSDPYDFDSKDKDAEREKRFDAWVYHCSSCGAELMTTDESDVTSFCPYCGTTSILFDRLKKVEYPAHIIPFRLTKEDCKRAYAKEARRAIFTPKRYKSPERIDSFRGIYMPFWSYEADYSGGFTVDFETSPTRDGDYLVSEQFRLTGTIEKHCEGYAHDASAAFSDELSESLAPFATEQQKPFTPGFLSGFYADAADVDAKAYLGRAVAGSDEEVREAVLRQDRVSAEIGSCSVSSVTLPKPKTTAGMAMYPVWFMSYREGDRITYAAVNGQTGKVAADFPVSTGRYLAAVLVLASALFAVFNFVLTIKPDWALGITTVLMLLGLWVGSVPYRRTAAVPKSPAGDRKKGVGCLIVFDICLAAFAVGCIAAGEEDLALTGAAVLIFLILLNVVALRKSKNTTAAAPADGADDRDRPFRLPAAVKILVWCVAVAALLIIFLAKPVYNLWYYIPALIEAVILFIVIFQSFRYQLERATRRPPQFNKEGGDDNA